MSKWRASFVAGINISIINILGVSGWGEDRGLVVGGKEGRVDSYRIVPGGEKTAPSGPRGASVQIISNKKDGMRWASAGARKSVRPKSIGR